MEISKINASEHLDEEEKELKIEQINSLDSLSVEIDNMNIDWESAVAEKQDTFDIVKNKEIIEKEK